MTKTEITKDILIETLVEEYPFSVRFLMEKGIRCIMCGEPIWGTLGEACTEKNFSEGEIETLVSEMKTLAEHGSREASQPDTDIHTKKME